MLRVDHAGEAAAVAIYEGQAFVLRGTPAAPLLAHMREGEVAHLKTLDGLLAARRVRPSLLLPLWRAAGFALGAASALLGTRSAMAATVSVETAISGHYNAQVRELLAGPGGGGGGGHAEPGDAELVAVFAQHRDEEVAHHDTAVAEGARDAPGFAAQDVVIRGGCAAAIQVASVV